MIGTGYVCEMAAYNTWQNGAVHGLCDALPEAERERDRGLFFGSLHRTLDHVAMVDGWILDTLDGVPTQRFDPQRPACATWTELQARRAALDARIEAPARCRDGAWLEAAIPVESARLGRVRQIPRALYLMQMFNHATHHRSQATAALWRMGIDYGCTDIPFRPGSPY